MHVLPHPPFLILSVIYISKCPATCCDREMQIWCLVPAATSYIDCWGLRSFLGCDTVLLGLWFRTFGIVQCLHPEGLKGPRRIIFIELLDRWRWRCSFLETWWPTIRLTAVKTSNLALFWLLLNIVSQNWFYSPLSSSCISCFLLWFYHHLVCVCVFC